MLIALLTDPIQVADYTALFPNVSFPSDGPDAEWLAENNCKSVSVWKEHDSTQKLIPAEPYTEGDWVYTVQVVSKIGSRFIDVAVGALIVFPTVGFVHISSELVDVVCALCAVKR